MEDANNNVNVIEVSEERFPIMRVHFSDEDVILSNGIKGLELMAAFPDSTITGKNVRDDFKAVCEFVLEYKKLVEPFWSILEHYLNNNLELTFEKIKDITFDIQAKMSINEAFEYVSTWKDCKKLNIERLLRCLDVSPVAANLMQEGISDNNKDKFREGVNKSDSYSFLQSLLNLYFLETGNTRFDKRLILKERNKDFFNFRKTRLVDFTEFGAFFRSDLTFGEAVNVILQKIVRFFGIRNVEARVPGIRSVYRLHKNSTKIVAYECDDSINVMAPLSNFFMPTEMFSYRPEWKDRIDMDSKKWQKNFESEPASVRDNAISVLLSVLFRSIYKNRESICLKLKSGREDYIWDEEEIERSLPWEFQSNMCYECDDELYSSLNTMLRQIQICYSGIISILPNDVNTYLFSLISSLIKVENAVSDNGSTPNNELKGQIDVETVNEDLFDRFVGKCLHIERGAENGFAYRYRTNLIDLIRKTTTGTGLYAIAMLLFPIKPKPGRKTVGAELGNQPRLKKEISWKANLPAPRNHQEVVALLIKHFSHLEKYASIDKKSVQPARLIEQLVKEVKRGRSWIKDFIRDYWSPEMAKVFEEKLSPHKSLKDSKQS